VALYNRLQAAEAMSSATDTSAALEEGGTFRARQNLRRIKKSTSMRSALGCGSTVRGTVMDQLAKTVDGLDQWLAETGTILKREPLARAAFIVYIVILHLWCFALVSFHAVESEHGDLATLTQRKGAFHPDSLGKP
jgi:hypothetical protein